MQSSRMYKQNKDRECRGWHLFMTEGEITDTNTDVAMKLTID